MRAPEEDADRVSARRVQLVAQDGEGHLAVDVGLVAAELLPVQVQVEMLAGQRRPGLVHERGNDRHVPAEWTARRDLE
jgi:hypothetical protein